MAKTLRTNVLYEDFTTEVKDLPYEINTTSGSGWTNVAINTSNVLDMPVFLDNIANWFSDCDKLAEVDFSDNSAIHESSNYANSAYAFSNCSSLIAFPVALDKGVIDATAMYDNCRSIVGSTMESDTVVEAGHLFSNCIGIMGEPLVGANVINAPYMYSDCYGIYGNSIIPPSIVNAQGMFYNTPHIESSENVRYSNIVDSSFMYYNCKNLQSDFYTPINATNIDYMYYEAGNEGRTYGIHVGENVKDMNYAFFNVKKINNLNCKFNNVVNAVSAFERATPSAPTQYDIHITSNLVNAYSMFNWCGLNLNVSFDDDLIIENCATMFNGCSNLYGTPKCPDIPDNAYRMYKDCYYINGAPSVGNNIVDAFEMYKTCIALDGETNVTDVLENCNAMYKDCIKLNGTPKVGNNTIDAFQMYMGCSNITGNLNLVNNCNNLNNTYQMFNNCFKSINSWVVMGSVPDAHFWNNGIPTILGITDDHWSASVDDENKAYFYYNKNGYNFRVYDGSDHAVFVNHEDSTYESFKEACHAAAVFGDVEWIFED